MARHRLVADDQRRLAVVIVIKRLIAHLILPAILQAVAEVGVTAGGGLAARVEPALDLRRGTILKMAQRNARGMHEAHVAGPGAVVPAQPGAMAKKTRFGGVGDVVARAV